MELGLGVRDLAHPRANRPSDDDESLSSSRRSDAEGDESEPGQVALVSRKLRANDDEAEDRSSSGEGHDRRSLAVFSLRQGAGAHAGILDWNEFSVWKSRLQVAGVLC